MDGGSAAAPPAVKRVPPRARLHCGRATAATHPRHRKDGPLRTAPEPPAPTTGRIVLAFAAIYLIWGSTYLAIKVAIESVPPFLMAATRFLTAGTLLYLWARRRGEPAPARHTWRPAAIAGGCMLFVGNGGVVWAEQRVASGLASLIVATGAFWLVILDWLWRGTRRPGAPVVGGLVVGFLGVGLLVSPGLGDAHAVDPVGAGALLLAACAWSVGSIYGLRATMASSPFVAAAQQMLAGGGLLLLTALAAGEATRVDPGAITLRSAGALGFLVLFGSLVAFTAYTWLLRVSTPARVSTSAYVNPVVAVILGWTLGAEPLTPRLLAASAIIILAVALITTARARRASAVHPAATAPPERPRPPSGAAR